MLFSSFQTALIAGAVRVAILLSISSTAGASSTALTREQCPTVDLAKSFGPIRSQQGSNWCWAVTDADLLGYALGVKPPAQVSALDVALQTFATTPERQLQLIAQAGDPLSLSADYLRRTRIFPLLPPDRLHRQTENSLTALIAYQDAKGICLESQLPLRGSGKGNEDSLTIIHERLLQLEKEAAVASWPGLANKVRDVVVDSTHLSWPSSRGAVRKIQTYVDQVRCQNRLPKKTLPLPTSVAVGDENQPLASPVIAERLRSKTPVAIAYNADFFDEDVLMRDPEDHESLIVGMRWTGTGCEFKLRNSWGHSRVYYHNPSIAKRAHSGYIKTNETELNETVSAVYFY